jgi:crotonobetainyl-CoA:carnitine CoA-transferase CaiB-like acyl-CoA transferase
MGLAKHDLLTDVRVLDASRVLAGPCCGQILGDLGAEVIKIERPGKGDETREWGPPFVGSLSAYYLSCNRNKRGLALDLSVPEGRRIFGELVKKSDVLIENFLPASARKLGLAADQLFALNPRLIVCSISGYGRTGPMSDLPGYDFAIQGQSGLMSITGPVEGPPSKVGVAVTDVLTGIYAATAILACLHARSNTGHGYAIDLALLDCALAAQVNLAQAYLATGQVPPRQGNAHLQIVPYQAFQTADDWLILAVGNDGQFQRFCQAAGRPDLVADARFTTNALRVENRGALVATLEELFRTRSAADWQHLLEAHQVPFAPVWDYAQLFAQHQVVSRSMCARVRTPEGNPVQLLGSPFHIDGHAITEPVCPPMIGQDSTQILRELVGIDDSELARLKREGALG